VFIYNTVIHYLSLSSPHKSPAMTLEDELIQYRMPDPPPSTKAEITETYEQEAILVGLPIHTGQFRWAKDIGRVRLARKIVSLDLSMESWKGSPFTDKTSVISRVTNMLASISDAAISLLVENRLHEVFFKPCDPELHLPFQHHSAQATSAELPIIYTLVHCGPTGRRPTKTEYIRVVDMIELYVREFESRDDPAWLEADTMAKEIDHIDPKIHGRSWASGTQGSKLRSWTKDHSGAIIPHPRRYCSSQRSRVSVVKWIEQTRKRFESIPADMGNQMLPWSFVYVGWTRQESIRLAEHYNHTGTTNSLA
jgi:hypothetical protein